MIYNTFYRIPNIHRRAHQLVRATLLTVATLLYGSVATSTLRAQTLTSIGKTVTGTDVLLETKSVARANGIITATLRTLLQPPIKTANGELKSSRSIAMLDCAKMKVATKESWYYFDEKGTKEGMHRKPGIPGFGSVTKGSLGDVALTHFCKQPKTPPQ